MSAEEGPAPPPPPAADKAAAPKAAATFSSFINKNTTGKKFAPKAARRRPGAAPVAPVPTPSTAETPSSTVGPTPSASERAPSTSETAPATSETAPATSETAPATSETAPATLKPPPPLTSTTEPTPSTIEATALNAQLPTPLATQEIPPSDAPAAGPTTRESAIESHSAPPPLNTRSLVPVERELQNGTRVLLDRATTPPIEHGSEQARAAKRRRLEPSTEGFSAPTPEDALGNTDAETALQLPPQETAHEELETAPSEVSATVARIGQETEEAHVLQSAADNAASAQPRKRRRLPWVAVNHPWEDGDQGAVVPKTRQPPKPRGRKRVTVELSVEEAEQLDGNDAEVQSVQKRARRKRTNATANPGTDAEGQPAPKKARKPRKPRKAIVSGVSEAGGEDAQDVDGAESTPVRRKPRQPKRRQQDAVQSEANDGEDGSQPKRRGRPPREPTPSDVEDQTIDPEETYMDSLASRNIRVGRLSNREREMRKVDWVAVRERRREEDARPIKSKEEQEAADKALAEAGAALDAQQIEMGPRFVEVNGRIEMVHDSGTINREADADREIATYEIHENQDITARITSRSFMKNNKRFPNDFILPGQGKRWTIDSTDLFYQGLKSFGTDFQMISHMFPGSTRRSIKTKFTREEREYPERVREALQGQSEIVSHWDVFLEASQLKEESFVDADKIKRQLAEDEAEMRERIAVAKLETEERNRQKAAAGVLDEDNDGEDAANKENGKGKKKRKEKGKQVSFQEEEGVEIVGNVDDDDTWGQQ